MGTNSTGCTEWERDFDPITEQPSMKKIYDVLVREVKGRAVLNLTYIIISDRATQDESDAEALEAFAKRLVLQAKYLRSKMKMPSNP